ncbi:hypothetical protein [Gottfriedia acidiceleris]|uniref:hypothetical protein n=1 Tax=Gottfriedia acidiceleris TaxID=371036 RepID=UPI002FFFE361
MKNKKKHPLYYRWKAMLERCYKSNNNNFKYYGAKGTIVSKRWHDFGSFVEDVENHLENGHLLYEEDFQLDKDINGENIYSLENCVVISAEENRKFAYEKQQKKIVAVAQNETIQFDSVSEASRILNIPRNTIQSYLKNEKQHSSGFYFKYCS